MPSSGGGRVGLLVAGLVSLAIVAGGGFFAWNAFSDTGGADTPEEAVQAMYEALATEDFVTLAEMIEPTERRTLVAPSLELAAEMQRLGLLADTDDPDDPVPGFEVEFTGLEVTSEMVTDDIARVRFDSGVSTASVDSADLPWGPVILDRLSADEVHELFSFTDSSAQAVGGGDDGDAVAVVRRDGRWYVSLWYSVAELGRTEAGEAFPSERGPQPVGSETPGEAVRAMMDAIATFDAEGVISTMDPEETAALYDYAPLFLTELDAEFDSIREQTEVRFERLDVAEVIDGDDAVVTIGGGSVNVTTVDLDVSFEWSAKTAALEGMIDGDPVDMTAEFDGECLSYSLTIGGETESDRDCDESYAGAFGVGESIFEPEFRTRKVDGQWYVSPTSSMMQPILEQVRMVEREELEAWIDDVAELGGEASDTVFGTGGISTGDVIDLEPTGPANIGVIDWTGDATSVTATLANGRTDEWTIALAEGETVAITAASNDFDGVLSVYVDGDEVAYNDDFDGLNPGLTYQASSSGDAVINVSALGGGGAYELSVEVGDPGDALVSAIQTVETIEWDGSPLVLERAIGANGYSFELIIPADGQLTVVAAPDGFDALLSVFTPSFDVDVYADDHGVGIAETVTTAVAAGDEVQLIAEDWNFNGGAVTLTIELDN